MCYVTTAVALPHSRVSLHKAGRGLRVGQPARLVNGSRPLLKSGGVGGPNGTVFDDWANTTNASIVGIRSINISHGDQVDAIQVSYLLANGSIYQAPRHGNYTTPPITITFESDEYVVKVEGKTNNAIVDQLTITTMGPSYETRVYGPFGKTGNLSFAFEGYVMAFHGRSGNLLDNIGVYSLELAKKSDTYGGKGGSPFDDLVDGRIPPVTGISRLYVWHEQIIGAIQVEYILLGNTTYLAEVRGNHDSPDLTLSTIEFSSQEQIIAFHGTTGEIYNLVNTLEITTRKQDGFIGSYGPFGKNEKEPFSFVGNIYGFFGASGNNIDTLGVYYT